MVKDFFHIFLDPLPVAESKDSNRVMGKFIDLVLQLEHALLFPERQSGFDLRENVGDGQRGRSHR